MQLANRISEITPSPTLAITAKAKEMRNNGVDVIDLGAGEPDFNTPQHIIDAAYKAMGEGKTKYTPSGGIPQLKEAIGNKLKTENGLTYESNQIIITLGAKHALYLLFQVICDAGDEVLIPAPYWVSYPEQVKLSGAVPIYIEGKKENNYKITAKQLEEKVNSKTKALILNSPSNPTGTIYNQSELIELAEVCKKHDILIVSDEVYEKFLYDGLEHISIAALSEDAYKRTIVINGLSKSYSMTGWRIGYAAGDSAIIKAMTDIASHSTSNPVSFAQFGAVAALRGSQEELQLMTKEFEQRRNYVINELREIPQFEQITPYGAFYVFVNVGDDADEWSKNLLEKAKVAVIPGSGFGAKNFVRISYANSLDNIKEGLKRIKEFIQA